MLAILTFTNQGAKVAKFVANFFGSKLYYFGNEALEDDDGMFFVKNSSSDRITDYFKEIYMQSSGIVFISACGIAVRLIAPLLIDKTRDKPVVVIDDGARYVISLLSGHEGGANKLADEISCSLKIESIITTGSESAKNLILGLGMRKGVSEKEIEEAVNWVLDKHSLSINNIRMIATADVKSKEKGLLSFAYKKELPIRFMEIDKLKQAERAVKYSLMVKQKIGAGSVCEASAILAGTRTELTVPKIIYRKKITVAVAREKYLWEV
ncbi:MAG: cobalamin biosynthesis protein [Actinomycetota bacterium]|nr:cobalamin biosynthesis protein [Actinomycetota bacterium]